jgi:hypothetical protein
MAQASRGRFDDSPDAAEALDILLPATVESTHCQFNLLGKLFREDVDDSIDQFVINLNLLPPDVGNSFDVVNVQVCMASAVELIINFEDPGIHVEVVCYQFRKLKHEFLLIVDINGAYWRRHIGEGEYLLSS